MTDKIQRACIVLFSGVFALIWLAVMAVCAADLKQSRQICTHGRFAGAFAPFGAAVREKTFGFPVGEGELLYGADSGNFRTDGGGTSVCGL